MAKIMQAVCDDGFLIQSKDQKEIVADLKKHLWEKHHMKITDKEAKEQICTC